MKCFDLNGTFPAAEYIRPPLELLQCSDAVPASDMNEKIEADSSKLLYFLEISGIQAELTHVSHGPSVIRYVFRFAPGTEVSAVSDKADLLRTMDDSLHVEAWISDEPEERVEMSVEIPKDEEKRETVFLRDILQSQEMQQEESPLAVALGRDVSGRPVVADLAKTEPLLIAGDDSSELSGCLHAMIQSLLYRASPEDVRLILISAGNADFDCYQGIAHLLAPVASGYIDTQRALSWASDEIRWRNERLKSVGVRNIEEYNEAIGPNEKPMSRSVIIIDELYDLVHDDKGESLIRSASYWGRSAGVHLVAATCRLETLMGSDVRGYLPDRIAFKMDSGMYSFMILGESDAEKLLGKGDMLYAPLGEEELLRAQGCFVSEEEKQRTADWIRSRYPAAYCEGTHSLRDVLESPEMEQEKSPTAVALGKSISGAPVIADLAKMPHLLIAGENNNEKQACFHAIILSILLRASPADVRLIMIAGSTLSMYNGIAHLLVPVITDPGKASGALNWAVEEMNRRYRQFETMRVRNIEGYNKAIGPDEEPMSKIVIMIEELDGLMRVAPDEVEESICRLAQMARAVGIHLVIATQRLSADVIRGVIKANIPSRIAFAVPSRIESIRILDCGGAENLLGEGDMLYAPLGSSGPMRVRGCFVSNDGVLRIVDFVRGKHTAEYDEAVLKQMNAKKENVASDDAPQGGEPVDEMLAKAIELAVGSSQASISMLQRNLRVGYAHACRLMAEMERRGIVGEADGPTKPRTVLISREEWRCMQENPE